MKNWLPKKWRFWTVVLEKTFESSLDCKEIKPVNPKGNQSCIYSLEELMLKLKLQYFGHLMWRADCLEKILMLGKIEGRKRRDHRGWDGGMASPTQRTWIWASFERWWRTDGMLQFMGSQRVRHDWAMEQQIAEERNIAWKRMGVTFGRCHGIEWSRQNTVRSKTHNKNT